MDLAGHRADAGVAGHCGPLRTIRSRADEKTASERVAPWSREWPSIAERYPRFGRAPSQVHVLLSSGTVPPGDLIEALAEMTCAGIGDVEIHIHHDGEGEQILSTG